MNNRHPDGTLKPATFKGWAILYVIVFGLLALKTCGGPDELEMEERQYCEMVALHKADPSVGWPDYNRNYDEVCK